MSKFDKRIVAGMLGAAVAFALPAVSFALTPYSAGLDLSETMEDDNDTYTPTNNDPFNDPLLDGTPPGDVGTDPGGEDGEDIRNGGGTGVFEELPNGHLDNAGNPVSAPDGSAHFAIAQYQQPNFDAYTRTNRNTTDTIVSGFYGDNGYQATQELYIDPSFQGNGYSNGQPDFWTTYSVNSNIDNNYYTEAGFQIFQNGGSWDIYFGGHTAPSELIYSAPVGTWVGLEMQPIPGAGGTVDFEARVTDAAHSTVLGSITFQEYTLVAQFNNLTGPRNNVVMLFGDGQIPYAFVDNVGWVSGRDQVVPEPGSLALLGLGAVGMLARRRRNA